MIDADGQVYVRMENLTSIALPNDRALRMTKAVKATKQLKQLSVNRCLPLFGRLNPQTQSMLAEAQAAFHKRHIVLLGFSEALANNVSDSLPDVTVSHVPVNSLDHDENTAIPTWPRLPKYSKP